MTNPSASEEILEQIRWAKNPQAARMCNSPPLCVPYCGDYHGVLEFDGREQRSKIDEGIILQVSSRESLEEKKKKTIKKAQLLSALVVLCASVALLWDPSLFCGPYLSLFVKKAQHFLTRAYMEWSVMQRCCCLDWLWAVHQRDFIRMCTVQPHHGIACTVRSHQRLLLVASTVHQPCSLNHRSWRLLLLDASQHTKQTLQLWNYHTSMCREFVNRS